MVLAVVMAVFSPSNHYHRSGAVCRTWSVARETNAPKVDGERTEGAARIARLADYVHVDRPTDGRYGYAAWCAAFTRPSARAVRPISNCCSPATRGSSSSTRAVNGKSS